MRHTGETESVLVLNTECCNMKLDSIAPFLSRDDSHPFNVTKLGLTSLQQQFLKVLWNFQY